jgi:hypothetical protein
MYKRHYNLLCEGEAKMNRFRIVTTQGLSFSALMKRNNAKIAGFIEAQDNHYDNEKWEITTVWEDKASWEKAQLHPMAKIFWNRFEMEAFKHELKLVVIDGDTGETYEPLAF